MRRSLLKLVVTCLFASFFAQVAGAGELRVLTLNSWMLRLAGLCVAKDLNPRLRIMPYWVASSGADLITLQEVWTPSIRNYLIRELKQYGYPYVAYRQNSFPFGNGLLILSKYPLDSEVKSISFSKVTGGEEKFVKKGAIKTRIELPELGWVDLYTTHLGAMKYDQKKKRIFPRHLKNREKQGLELVEWIHKTRQEKNMILTADMNTHYERLDAQGRRVYVPEDYKRITSFENNGLGLTDTARDLAGQISSDIWTFDTINNSYAKEGSFGFVSQSETIDYIFVNRTGEFYPERVEIVFKEPIDKTEIFLKQFMGSFSFFLEFFAIKIIPRFVSDHYGLMTQMHY